MMPIKDKIDENNTKPKLSLNKIIIIEDTKIAIDACQTAAIPK
jgi:hypothetical protein